MLPLMSTSRFALVALFSKFGKISKLDFLFHKSGVLRGKPRGYAFIEMNRRDEALRAMVELNNKPVRGKRILVTQANESQYQEHQAANQSKPNNHSHQNNLNHPGRPGQRGRPPGPDPMRPTTLSILKSQQQPKGVNNKIAALEAKLASMQQAGSSSTALSSSNNTALPSSTSSLLSTKPSFLPENPNTLPPTAWNQLPSSTSRPDHSKTTHKKSCKSSTSSYNQYKNSVNLDAIGLTLKEQLKRNRESQSSHTKAAKQSASTNEHQIHHASLTQSISPAHPKHSRNYPSHEVETCSTFSDQGGRADVSLPVTEKALTVERDSKRQKCCV
ncbi:hypothetical protein VP01_925g5 [Puccinia sorghi]|uniref:RRM domain-containing protein n=1 Tax=Puccinia sorghi TaxID=27349 RepID=A0A0L6U7S6_9BASI|nr:hypothetical protein VP01_925g5 [Puccinia sorghi]